MNIINNTCAVCESPLTRMTLNRMAYCSSGMGCEYILQSTARGMAYKGDMAVLADTNLDAVDILMDNGDVRALPDLYSLTDDALRNVNDSKEYITSYHSRAERVLSTLTLHQFLRTVNIPGVRTHAQIAAAVKYIWDDTVADDPLSLPLSIGRLLVHWENDYGHIVTATDNVLETERALHYLMPHNTKIAVQKLSDLFVERWYFERYGRKEPDYSYIDRVARRQHVVEVSEEHLPITPTTDQHIYCDTSHMVDPALEVYRDTESSELYVLTGNTTDAVVVLDTTRLKSMLVSVIGPNAYLDGLLTFIGNTPFNGKLDADGIVDYLERVIHMSSLMGIGEGGIQRTVMAKLFKFMRADITFSEWYVPIRLVMVGSDYRSSADEPVTHINYDASGLLCEIGMQVMNDHVVKLLADKSTCPKWVMFKVVD